MLVHARLTAARLTASASTCDGLDLSYSSLVDAEVDLEALLRSSAVKARYVVVGRRAVAPPPQQEEEEPESLYRRCKTFYVFLFLSLCISVFFIFKRFLLQTLPSVL